MIEYSNELIDEKCKYYLSGNSFLFDFSEFMVSIRQQYLNGHKLSDAQEKVFMNFISRYEIKELLNSKEYLRLVFGTDSPNFGKEIEGEVVSIKSGTRQNNYSHQSKFYVDCTLSDVEIDGLKYVFNSISKSLINGGNVNIIEGNRIKITGSFKRITADGLVELNRVKLKSLINP